MTRVARVDFARGGVAAGVRGGLLPTKLRVLRAGAAIGASIHGSLRVTGVINIGVDLRGVDLAGDEQSGSETPENAHAEEGNNASRAVPQFSCIGIGANVLSMAKRSATRARGRADADIGVRDCVELMTKGLWVSGRSHQDIAFKHGVSPATVKDWATSASRVIRLACEGDLEDIRARMITTLEGITADARSAGEYRAAVSSVETAAKLLGLIVQKHEVAPSPEEVQKLLAEAAELAAKK